MSTIQNFKIAQLANLIASLPVKPNATGGLTAADLQTYFDSSSDELRAASSSLIDALLATTGASEIGAVVPAGFTQATVAGLINEFAANIVSNQAAAGVADGKADTAISTANAAASLAATANGKSDTAVSTANAASSAASAAVSTANAAASLASAADGKADTAVNTANAAASSAAQAVLDADAAATAAQAAEAAVALKADVSYVDQVAANFVLGIVVDGSITLAKLETAVQNTLSQVGTNATAISDNATAIGNNTTLADSKATKYQGNADFPIGVSTYQVNSATCTANTLVDVYIQSAEGVKLGVWEVEAFAGYFIITTDTLETSLVNFEWKYEV